MNGLKTNQYLMSILSRRKYVKGGCCSILSPLSCHKAANVAEKGYCNNLQRELKLPKEYASGFTSPGAQPLNKGLRFTFRRHSQCVSTREQKVNPNPRGTAP